jgi:hypothetical protein
MNSGARRRYEVLLGECKHRVVPIGRQAESLVGGMLDVCCFARSVAILPTCGTDGRLRERVVARALSN